MKIGMLWADFEKCEVAVKVIRAAEYYARKYGRRPNRCFVHPEDLRPGEDGQLVEGVQVVGDRRVVRRHLWVGVEEEATPPPPVGGGEGAICLRVGGTEPKEGLLSGVGEGLRC